MPPPALASKIYLPIPNIPIPLSQESLPEDKQGGASVLLPSARQEDWRDDLWRGQAVLRALINSEH